MSGKLYCDLCDKKKYTLYRIDDQEDFDGYSMWVCRECFKDYYAYSSIWGLVYDREDIGLPKDEEYIGRSKDVK